MIRSPWPNSLVVEGFDGDPDDCVAGWGDFIADRDTASDVDEDDHDRPA